MTSLPLTAGRTDGFAVVDVETTGLYPSKDRVIEIAVVTLDSSLRVIDEFSTLINPNRDVGPTSIHGISARDVIDAPTFAEAVWAIWERLSGRVFVAHNARFDASMVGSELYRVGFPLPPPPIMCTMLLAGSYLHRLPSRSLVSCCDAAGIRMRTHHTALSDARATAQLLQTYSGLAGAVPQSWVIEVATAATIKWSPQPATSALTPLTRDLAAARRLQNRAPLAPLVHRLPRGDFHSLQPYFAVLDRALEDRLIDQSEVVHLATLALEHGVTRQQAEAAHEEYLRHVATAAWADGEVSDAERTDLLSVAEMLDVPEGRALEILGSAASLDQSLSTTVAEHGLTVGDCVVFTGEMARPRSELERLARDAGLRAASSVSKKTALVVTADPHSHSGKASAAREKGIRIVTEQVFLSLIQHVAPSRPST